MENNTAVLRQSALAKDKASGSGQHRHRPHNLETVWLSPPTPHMIEPTILELHLIFPL